MIFYPDILGRLVCPSCGFILLRADYYPYILNCPKCGEKIDKPEPAEVHHETPITSKNVNEIQFTVNGVKIMRRVPARPLPVIGETKK